MVAVHVKPGPQNSDQQDIHDVQYANLVFGQVRMRKHSHIWRPPTDVYETGDAVIVRVEVAGMRDNDFSIVIDGRYLYVRGVRMDSPERRAYYQMEIPYGEFGTEVKLPRQVVVDSIEAIYSNGFLRIVMPIARPHRVQIED
jgi:HSP20 family molecular chaperone IbpA